MNFWKKLFAGMGFVCGFLVFETMSLAYHNSRRRHKNRKGRCRRNSFWDTLTRYMIFAWIYDGVKKSRERPVSASQSDRMAGRPAVMSPVRAGRPNWIRLPARC